MNSSTHDNNNDVNNTGPLCPVCKMAASKICSGCRSVSYCSVEHQKQHWKKEHKHSCRVWTVKVNDVMGRFIVATRDIPAGTVIMDEEALVIGPKQDTLPVCLGCYAKVDGSYFCSHCFFPMCSEDCEKLPCHTNNECRILRKKRALPKALDYNIHHAAYECILAIRCLRLKETDPKKWEKLGALEHHNSLRKELQGLWNRNEVNVVRFLREVYKVDVEPMTIHTVVGYADINCFEIRLKNKESIVGLFPNVALMAHECISNTHHAITDDFRMIVRNVVPIRKGQMITTTYTHTLESTMVRRTHVKESKLFDCICSRCQDPTEMGTHLSSLKCKNCPEGYLLPQDPLSYNPVWRCNDCGTDVPNNTVSALLDSIREEIEEAEHVQSVIELLEGVIQKYSGNVLHRNNYLLVWVLHSLSQMYGRVKGWSMEELSLDSLKRKEEICRRLLEVIDVIEPGLSRIRGATFFELQQAIYFRVQKEYESQNMTEDELKVHLLEVLEMLKLAMQIFSFDSPSSSTGKIAKQIPDNMAVVKTVLKKVCLMDVD